MYENIKVYVDIVTKSILPLPLPEEEFLNHEDFLTPMANFEYIRKIFPEINIVPTVTDMELQVISGITLYGFINFFNAFTSVSAIDIYINDVKVISNLKYSAFSQYYKAFPGYYHIQVYAAGTKEFAFSSTFLNIIGYRVYTGAFSGIESHACLLMINDCVQAIPQGISYLRIVQISPNAPLMNAFLDEILILSEVDYREVSRYYAVKEGVHTLKMEDYFTREILSENSHLELVGQNAYTVYMIGDFTKADGLQMMIVRDGISFLEF